MLYVFHVDVGRMMSFDMTVALSSVENLKDTIERLHGIPAANIVLLVSGGEMLTQSTQVSYYSAGTDTNPIYMFLTGDVRLPPAVPQSEPDLDLREQVERSLELPVCYDTVEKRAKLALRMHDLAREEDRLCERYVHEQHLQQQGWSAVVANMEDLTYDFRLRFRDFCAAFDRHLEKRSKYLDLLRSFGEDLSKLARIPILPGLMPLAEADFHGFDKLLDNDDVFSNTQQESVLVAAGTNVLAQRNAAMLDAVDNKDEESKTKITHDEEESSGSGTTGATVAAGEAAVPVAPVRRSNSQSTNSTSSTRRQNSLNLLQWITSKENHNALKLMSDECIQGLSTFSDEIYDKLKIEVKNIIKLAEQTDVKEIKGLGERLCKLEEFKYKIKAMVKDQKELSTALQQNQNRAMNLGDTSVLPDLCASHQSQLLVMLQNHQKIRDLRRLIAKAKDELGVNLHTRLKRIVWIENAMSEFDNRLLFYHRCLCRAERHICIIEQIHQAPCIYVAAVTEVVRRRIFSCEFRDWAVKLSEDFAGIHSEEIKRRQLFNASFEGHFLNILFPGMNDMPPAFANDNSLVFDTGLPNLTKSDIDTLTSQLPDLATQIQLPDMDSVINFFVSRSGEDQKERMEELLKRQVAIVLNIELSTDEKPLQHQRVSDLQKEAVAPAPGDGGDGVGVAADVISTSVGCDECETDTETEFEQLPAATPVLTTTIATSTSENVQPVAVTMARSTATEPLLTQSAGTLTEETDLGALSEIARMRELLSSMSKAAMDCLRMARNTLGNFRVDAESYRDDFQADMRSINDKWHQMHTKICENEQQLQEASNEQSNELRRLRYTVQQRDNDLLMLRMQLDEMDSFRIKCATMETQMEELRDKLKTAQDECNAAVAEAREELIHEHKTEIESLRCRFKLMTSMERSPSDTSLEKIERPTSNCDSTNIIEFVHHEAILAQQRATFEAEKERAISAAIEIERSLWQSKIFPMNSESVMANANILRDMLEEKERQLEQLREKDLVVTKENFQLKTRLDALTNDEGNSWLQEKIDILKIAKTRLEEELTSEKAKRLEMESSFAALKNSTYEPGILPRSKSSGSSQKYIVLESCSKGDIVFVVWSIRHGQFMVVQDSQSLYFVHGDSLSSLNLRIPIQTESMAADEVAIPMPYYAIGRVVEKEYCQARKDENRYRVTRGSKFYRIKLEPLTTRILLRRERLESNSSSTSRSMSQYESQSESAAIAIPPQTTQQILRAKIGATSNNQNINKDSVDGSTITSLGIVTPIVTSTTATNTKSGQIALTQFKERTVSITSVTEEDDEPLSIRSERCHYTSVSEEDEIPAAISAAEEAALIDAIKDKPMSIIEAAATPTSTQKILAQTVITEQPTASTTKEMQLQLMLASVEIATQPQPQLQLKPQQKLQSEKEEDSLQQDVQITTAEDENAIVPIPATTNLVGASEAQAIEKEAEAEIEIEKKDNDNDCIDKKDNQNTSSQIVISTTPTTTTNINTDNTTTTISSTLTATNLPTDSSSSIQITASYGSPSIPTSTGTASEDSDEFRSLEGKDDADFPISE